MKTDNVIELENIEVKKYLDMISKKGYGHTIEDTEKRVRAGIAIAHHIQRQKFAACDSLLSALKDALQIIERMSDEYSEVANKHASFTNGEYKRISEAIKQAEEL